MKFYYPSDNRTVIYDGYGNCIGIQGQTPRTSFYLPQEKPLFEAAKAALQAEGFDFSTHEDLSRCGGIEVLAGVQRTETAEIIFEYGGQKWRSDDPRGAINAMLSVSAGKNSKSLAWSLAYRAVEQCRVFFPEIADELKQSLGNGRYPESVSI